MDTIIGESGQSEYAICCSNQLMMVPNEDAPPPPLPCTCTVTIVAQENEELALLGECHVCSPQLYIR